KRLRWQIVIVVLALLVIAALLLWQQPEVVQQVVTVQPATGGVYTEALIGSFGRLNPLLNLYNPADRDVNRLIFNGLVSFDDRGLPQGDLAESWGISQDGTIYNFSIREEATWHDGRPVTSEDVVFTLDLMRSEEFPTPQDIREFWDEIEVKDLDDKTLQFRLPEPFAPFLDYLTFGVLPKHLLEAIPPDELVDASFNQEPVGTGPYRFDHLLSEEGSIQGVVLSAYDDYYRDRAFIDQVVFRYYPDSESALAAYREGEVMGIGQIDGGILAEVLQEPDLSLYTGRLPLLSLVYMNLDNPELPFFQGPTLRRALLMGINRQWLVDRVLNSQAVIADGPIPPGTWAYYDEIERLNYDSETAINLLKEAGYTIPAEGGSVRVKEDVALSFEMVYPDDPINTALAEAIQKDWGKLGVEVNIKPVTYEVLLSDYLEPRTYQAALVALNLTRTPDPDPYPFWDQAQITGGQNYASWDDRQASEYLEQARISVDIGERTRAYRNFQVRFTQEMPALPLVYSVYSYVVDEQVLGVSMGPLFDPSDRFATITSWFLLANRPSVPEITPSESPQ
ncbi:MAG: peptide ABC transporter substrate-binding protein, partial [Anaerolineales bacterium]|nr:peptide ABC transporter substrate-binding protein [Anaerolineales bacterium]